MAKRAIYYDTETTGVKAERDRVIEIAAFDPLHNRTFEELINPGIPIPAEATAIHNISDEMVSTKPGFSEVGRRFIDFCDGDVVLIAHNNDNFDLHFLRHEFQRGNLVMPDWTFLDTLKWARKYRPDLPRHSLQFLREIYGVPANNAHRALDDVVVLHRVFSYLLDDLSIDQAVSLLTAPREVQTMPFGKFQGKRLEEVPKDYVEWLSKNGALDKPENTALRAGFVKAGQL